MTARTPHGRATHRLRARTRKLLASAATLALAAGALVSLGLVVTEQPAQALDQPRFTPDTAMIWVSQGKNPNQGTGLFETEVSKFNNAVGWQYAPVGTNRYERIYNGLAYNPADGYLYSMLQGTKTLLRTGQGTDPQTTGIQFGIRSAAWTGQLMGGIPSQTAVNQGTFGEGDHANIYYFRDNAKPFLYAFNVVTNVLTTKPLDSSTPNFSDFSYRNGSLWAVDGAPGGVTGTVLPKLYRIDPDTGAVELIAEDLPIAIGAYGAQWFFGNGNLGLSYNGATGKQPYYQLSIFDRRTGELILDQATGRPAVTVASTSSGRSSIYNDGASYQGEPVDLKVKKEARTLLVGDGVASYTITVTNNSPSTTSSGYSLHDVIDARLLNPSATWDPETDNCTTTPNPADGSHTLECFGKPLPPQASRTFTVYANYVGLLKDECIPNTAEVLGNEADPDMDNDTSAAVACGAEPGPKSFVVTKSAVVDQAVAGSTASSTVPQGFIDYTITAANNSDGPLLNADDHDFTAAGKASFEDNLTGVMDDASAVSGIQVQISTTDATRPLSPVGTATFDAASRVLSWSGELKKHETATITYRVAVAAVPGDYSLNNRVTPGVGGSCLSVQSCETKTPIASYVVSKEADKTVVAPEGTIRYTLTASNIGQVAYTDASFSDDLSDVLQSAAYNGDAAYADDPAEADYDATASAPAFTAAAETLDWSGALAIGETKTFSYTVDVNDRGNLGDRVLENTVRPTAPAGRCLEAGACEAIVNVSGYTVRKAVQTTGTPSDPLAALPGSDVTYTITVKNDGMAAYVDGVNPASFIDQLDEVLDDAAAPTALSSGLVFTPADEPAGTPATIAWSGDLAVNETKTFSYTVTVADPAVGTASGDHVLVNVVAPGADGICAAAGACRTETPVPVRSSVLAKTANKTQVSPGDAVSYMITVTNSGEVAFTAARPATVFDPLEAVLDDATLNAASITGGASYNATTKSIEWAGPLAVGEVKTITYSVTVKTAQPHPGDYVLRNAVFDRVTPPPTDCMAPTVCVPVRSYTVEKAADVAATHPDGTVVYEITLKNVGQVPYAAASYSDDLSDVLASAAYNGDAAYADDPADADFDAAAPAPVFDAGLETLNWSGTLAVGESKTFRYSVQVNDTDNVGDRVLDNVVAPTSPDGYCATATGCAVSVPISGYTVDKAVDVTVAEPGDDVIYTVTVDNIGLVDYAAPGLQASFTDTLTDVLDDASTPFDLSPGLVFTPAAGGTPATLAWAGDLAAGERVELHYTVTVKTPASGNRELYNTVAPGAEGSCVAVAECETETPILERSMVTTKTVNKTSVGKGDTVVYTITVTNTGELAYTAAKPARFFDPLREVLDDATLNAGSLTGGAVYDASAQVLAWAGPLALNETKTFTYSVTVKTERPHPGDYVLRNTVFEGTPCTSGPDCPVPPVCQPGDVGCTTPPICQPGDPNCTEVPVADWTISKKADVASAWPGDTVKYTILVSNIGAVDYTGLAPLSFTDDLSDVLDDAVLNVASITGGATYAAPTLSWSGPLAVGATATVSYTVTVNAEDTGDLVMRNVVTTPPSSTCEPGSTNPDCRADVPIVDFVVAKSVDVSSAQPGDTVNYTVLVTNTGEVGADLSFVDDMSAVIENADYNNDARSSDTAHTLGYSAPRLSWTGFLAVGESATVRYSVTVHRDAPESVLTNVVTTPPAGNCLPAGEQDPDCRTDTPVPPTVPPTTPPTTVPPTTVHPNPPLEKTGFEGGGWALLALLALGSGAALLGIRRRRSANARS